MEPPTASDLSSAARKFMRGVKHVKTLLQEVEDFEGRDAFVFSWEVEKKSPRHHVYRCFAVEKEPIPDHWPLFAGEAIQNLRSALDHVVYAASGGNSRTQFPILIEPNEFKERATGWLRGVPEQTQAIIERAQPYHVAAEHPAQDMLQVLRKFSNIDKHRTLATVATAVQHESVGINEGVDVNWEEFATGKTLTGGRTQVSMFSATGERDIEESDVQPQFDYHVQIEGRPFQMLKGIVHRVYRVLAECETGNPLPLFAPYPL